MNKNKGFTLVEAMVVVIIMVLVMSAIYMIIMHYRDVSGIEQARVRQTQESRYMMSIFSSELKEAGSVLTLTNTGAFLSVLPHFNGIYPLNNNDFADGLIVASGDPKAVNKLAIETSMSSATQLNLYNTIADPAWAAGDTGIVIGPDGYYVFKVSQTPSPGSASLSIRSQAVYYSGLLNTVHYQDAETPAGNTLTYPINAPVVRLDNFAIYLIQERDDTAKGHKVRELVRVSDCFGKAAVLTDFEPKIVKGTIAENIWDLQLIYSVYPDFPDVATRQNFFVSGSSGTLSDLLLAFRIKTFKEITVNVVALTDDYPGKGKVTYSLPVLADRGAENLPAGKFNYRTYSFLVQPRNFSIKI